MSLSKTFNINFISVYKNAHLNNLWSFVESYGQVCKSFFYYSQKFDKILKILCDINAPNFLWNLSFPIDAVSIEFGYCALNWVWATLESRQVLLVCPSCVSFWSGLTIYMQGFAWNVIRLKSSWIVLSLKIKVDHF